MHKINIRQMKHLCINTIYKEYHNKNLMMIFLATLFILYLINIVMGFFHGGPAEGEEGINFLETLNLGNLKLNAFYLIISSWNGILAILLGIQAIKSDQKYNVLQLVLSFPIKKSEYLLSRIFGTWIIVVIYYFLSFILALLLFAFSGDKLVTISPLLRSLFFTCLSTLPVIMIGIIFSFYLSKIWAFMVSILTTIFISYSGQQFMEFTFKERLGEIDGFFSAIGFILYHFFPRLSTLQKISQEFFRDQQLSLNPYTEFLHFVVTTFLLFMLLLYLFRQKEEH